MASASDHRAHAALQPADCLILLHQRLPATVETSIGPAHYPAECTQSDAFLQPSLRARNGRANSNSFLGMELNRSARSPFSLRGSDRRHVPRPLLAIPFAKRMLHRRGEFDQLEWFLYHDLVGERIVSSGKVVIPGHKQNFPLRIARPDARRQLAPIHARHTQVKESEIHDTVAPKQI